MFEKTYSCCFIGADADADADTDTDAMLSGRSRLFRMRRALSLFPPDYA
jgi:hypothetical protein